MNLTNPLTVMKPRGIQPNDGMTVASILRRGHERAFFATASQSPAESATTLLVSERAPTARAEAAAVRPRLPAEQAGLQALPSAIRHRAIRSTEPGSQSRRPDLGPVPVVTRARATGFRRKRHCSTPARRVERAARKKWAHWNRPTAPEVLSRYCPGLGFERASAGLKFSSFLPLCRACDRPTIK